MNERVDNLKGVLLKAATESGGLNAMGRLLVHMPEMRDAQFIDTSTDEADACPTCGLSTSGESE